MSLFPVSPQINLFSQNSSQTPHPFNGPLDPIERTQEILFAMHKLKAAGHMPDQPVFLDSPLAIKATEIFKHHRKYFDEEAKRFFEKSVNASVAKVSGFSAHADYDDLLKWCKGMKKPPKQFFVIHGEEKSAMAFKEKLQNAGFDACVPSLGETAEI